MTKLLIILIVAMLRASVHKINKIPRYIHYSVTEGDFYKVVPERQFSCKI